ncbi:MAG: radical SAM family heme chaperone HemW, partial [Burkholderiales bacterium]
IKQPGAYMQAAVRGASSAENRTVEPKELPFEFMLNAARLVEGFALQLFAARTGLQPQRIESGLRAAEEKGLIERDLSRVRPTPRGRRFLNDLVALFLQ